MKQIIRRNMLFVPGNTPSLFKDIIFYKPDTVMFDLEDSISFEQKDAARQLTCRMINYFGYEKFDIETAVRINHWNTSFYSQDLEAVVNSKAQMIRLPKIETKEEIWKVVQDIEKIEKSIQRKDKIVLFCAIESAKGVLNAIEIAQASNRVVGIALGGVDYLFDLQATRTEQRHELLFARQMLVHAARAAKIDVFDCIYGKVRDLVGLEKETKFAKELGFSGKSAIHPSQLDIIKKVFAPTTEEIENALKIINAYQIHLQKGQGVFTIDGQMIDLPFVEHARKLLIESKIPISLSLNDEIRK
ncbi:citrate lyase subunit beta [Candidatus Phytoplasma phoenicium]|uniref:Citrate lyase subunit beta n=1 Tax=Candidatus Phytoplasma phoenicium TaxID=198422 RepID=A0A2S8NUZ1_9MOLU|nr:citrate lyase subunit beta [Candidatus Phytoplasma phoenicium]